MIAVWLSVALAADIWLSTEAPVDGQPVQVTVDAPDPVGDLVVTYRPGSAVEASQTLPLGPGGTAQWTPVQPGLAVLSWEGAAVSASRSVSVRFAAVPLGGVAVFLVAGGLLFGGMAWAFSRLMRSPALPPPVDT